MKLKYRFEMMSLEDQMVAIPVGEEAGEFLGVVKLNETAAFIFNLLKDEITEETIIDALDKVYNVPREKLTNDVRRAINEFQEKGLLV